MDWSRYVYLAPVALAALALLALMCRRAGQLTAPSRQRTRLELVLLVATLALASLAIYGRFLLGDARWAYLDVGLDTQNQYVPFYLNMLDGIRAGTFGLWNFDFGLGTTAVSCQSWILDPFNLVLVPACLLLGDATLGQVLVVVQVLKVLLVGLLTDHLLTRYCRTPLARLLGSTLYALGGFLMLWGQHYWLGTAPVAFAALVLLLELQLERPSARGSLLLSLVSAMSLVWSVYVGFMCLLGAALYALLRLVHACHGRPARAWGRALVTLVAPVLAGCLVAGLALVPYASYLLKETGRVSGGEQTSLAGRAAASLTSFVPLSWLPMLASRLLGNGLVSCGLPLPPGLVPATESFPFVNVFELVMLGCSAAAVVVLLQFFHWAFTQASRCDRALIVIAALLVVLYCTNDFLPSLFNAMAAPKYRSSFVVELPLCVALAVGWEQRFLARRANLPLLVVGLALTLGVVGWSLAHTVNGRLVCLYFLAATVALVALTLAARKGERDGAPDALALADASAARRALGLATVAAALVVSTSVVDAFFVTNNRIFCVAGNFPGSVQSPLAQDTRAALDYLAQSDHGAYRVEKLYEDQVSFNDALVESYRGVSAYNSTIDYDLVDFYHQLWPEAVAGGTYYQNFRADPAEPELLGVMGVRYLLAVEPLDWEWVSEEATFGSVIVYRVNSADSMLTGRPSVMSESEAAALPEPLERRGMLAAATIVPDDVAAAWQDSDAMSLTTDVQIVGASTIEGTATADGNMVACLAVPHTTGWTVEVDGASVPTFRANYGFVGFELPAGAHQVRASFRPAGLGAGIAASALGVAVSLAVAALIARSEKRHTEKNEGAHLK